MTKQKLTPWYHVSINPVRKGWYEIRFHLKDTPEMRWWGGRRWHLFQRSTASYFGYSVIGPHEEWRGIAK